MLPDHIVIEISMFLKLKTFFTKFMLLSKSFNELLKNPTVISRILMSYINSRSKMIITYEECVEVLKKLKFNFSKDFLLFNPIGNTGGVDRD